MHRVGMPLVSSPINTVFDHLGIFTQLQWVQRILGRFVHRFKPTLVTESITTGTVTSKRSSLQPKSFPKSAPIRPSSRRSLRTISKTFMESLSATTKPIEPENVQSNSSTAPMKMLIALFPNTALKFTAPTPGARCNSTSTRKHVDSNASSLALVQVRWDLLIVDLCLALMVPI